MKPLANKGCFQFSHRKPVHSGFTLIELIIVIVILGVLAVVAAPRFLNISSDANASVLRALQGVIRSAVTLQHNVAILNSANGGLENGFINDDILFDQGYPVAADFDGNGMNGVPEILEALDINLDDWTFGEIFNGSENGFLTRELYITSSRILPNGSTAQEIIASNCYVSYDSFVTIPEPPVIAVVTFGC